MGLVEKTIDRHAGKSLFVRLPEELRDQLKERAELEERTLATVVRRALRLYLEDVQADR